MHAAADEVLLQHGAAPCGSANVNLNGFGAELRVAADQGLIVATIDQLAEPILCRNFENISRAEIAQIDSAFDLRLDDSAVDLITKIRAGLKKGWRRGFRTSRHRKSLGGRSSTDCPCRQSMQSACHWTGSCRRLARRPNTTGAEEFRVRTRPFRSRRRIWRDNPAGIAQFIDPRKSYENRCRDHGEPDKQNQRRQEEPRDQQHTRPLISL
jgi:hypothetical protein